MLTSRAPPPSLLSSLSLSSLSLSSHLSSRVSSSLIKFSLKLSPSLSLSLYNYSNFPHLSFFQNTSYSSSLLLLLLPFDHSSILSYFLDLSILSFFLECFNFSLPLFFFFFFPSSLLETLSTKLASPVLTI
ncbi:cyclin-dependent protein kinase inhibitor SMR6 [Iris pallida]|uniref:Cyclin-dependent protein kinase inhibitor SMR6 n=1 Tax=Iris pallida TaxID=29817 RepID=A0AAX6DV05_IRIPA|nr:cyclin-dependent protein kinase inhibitor SMR6 [Iris pallida]